MATIQQDLNQLAREVSALVATVDSLEKTLIHHCDKQDEDIGKLFSEIKATAKPLDDRIRGNEKAIAKAFGLATGAAALVSIIVSVVGMWLKGSGKHP